MTEAQADDLVQLCGPNDVAHSRLRALLLEAPDQLVTEVLSLLRQGHTPNAVYWHVQDGVPLPRT